MKNDKAKRITAEAVDLGIAALISLLLMCILALASGKGIVSFLLVCPIIYFLYQLCLGGILTENTPGQALLGVRVVPVKEKTIPPIDMIVRAIIKAMPLLVIALFPQIWYITAVATFIYALIPLVRKDGRGIHDLAADTKVMPAENVKEQKSLPEKKQDKEQKPTVEQNACAEETNNENKEKKENEAEENIPEFTPGMVVIEGEYKGAYIPLDKEVVLGRSTSCNLVFDESLPEVSRRHCSIRYDYAKDAYILTDLNSSYGTFLEDGSMLKGTAVLLPENAQFRIGKKEKFLLRRS